MMNPLNAMAMMLGREALAVSEEGTEPVDSETSVFSSDSWLTEPQVFPDPFPTVFEEASQNPTPPADLTLDALGDILSFYLPIFFVAFLVSLLLTPVMRRLAIKQGIVDRPDEARKMHREPIAYLGGVAIFVGWLIGVAAAFWIAPHTDPSARINFPVSVVIGAVAILITGLFDDVWGISPRVKIGGQLFAAAALASEDVGTQLVEQSIGTIQQIAIEPMGLADLLGTWVLATPNDTFVYLLGTLAIAVFVIGACNAVNLIDGLDGLAAGTSAISATGFLLIAAILAVIAPLDSIDPIRIVMCLAMIGALLGFLPHNFNPANIFMGDAGSLLVGYLACACILLFSYNTDAAALKFTTACLIVFAFPITDTALAIFRRKMAGQPLMSADAQHIHHILKRTGMGVKRCVLTIYGFSLVFAAIGVAMVAWEFRFRTLLTVAMVLFGFIFVTAYKFGRTQARATLTEERPSPPTKRHFPKVSTPNANGSSAQNGSSGNAPAESDPDLPKGDPQKESAVHSVPKRV